MAVHNKHKRIALHYSNSRQIVPLATQLDWLSRLVWHFFPDRQ